MSEEPVRRSNAETALDLPHEELGAHKRFIFHHTDPEADYATSHLQPAGHQPKGDLRRRFGNPTPLGLVSLLLCLGPFSLILMGWSGTSLAGASSNIGSFYFAGAFGMSLSGLLEWILGNTFISVVFVTLGGFFGSLGYDLSPTQELPTTLDTKNYYHGLALFLIVWAAVVLIYLVASLRTNVVFSALFCFLEIQLWLLITVFLRVGYADPTAVSPLTKTAGAFGFLASATGAYLFLVIILEESGFPMTLPVGDLSRRFV